MTGAVSTTGYVLIGLLVGIAVVFGGAVAYALSRPPRFLRLALGLTTGALVFLVAGVVVGGAFVVAGSGSTTIGSSVQIGRPGFDHVAGVRVSGPINKSVDGGDDQARRRWVRSDYGKGAYVDSGRRVTVVAERLSVWEWLASIGAIASWVAAAGLWLWALRGILQRAADGIPFVSANVRALQVMAGCTAFLGIAIPVIQHFLVMHFIHREGGHGSVGWGTSLTSIAAAVVLLALAEAWRYGIALHDDVAATV